MRRALTWALLALGAAVGCDGGCGACSGGAPKAGALVEPEARVELLDPGSAPRVELEVGRWQGLTYHWQVRNESSFGLQGNKPIKAPTVVANMTFQVTHGTADPVLRERGGRTLRLVEERATVDSIEVDPKGLSPELVTALNQGLAGYAGTRTRTLVGEDGELVEMKTELVGGVEPAPEEKEMLDRTWEVQRRFPFRLPPAAVGVGGKWRFSETIEMSGVKAVQVAEMTVTQIHASEVVIRVQVRQHAPRQELIHPFAPGKTALLEQFRGDGDGELTIDRLTGIPMQGKLSVTGRLTLATVGKPNERMSFIAASVLRSSARILGEGGLDPLPDAGEDMEADGGPPLDAASDADGAP